MVIFYILDNFYDFAYIVSKINKNTLNIVEYSELVIYWIWQNIANR